MSLVSCGGDRSGGPADSGMDGPDLSDGGVFDGGGDGDGDGGGGDGPVTCSADADCDDGLFCNGTELCMPGSAEGSDGCVAGSPPCADDQICDEMTASCADTCPVPLDADGDGHDTTRCGGDDCDDADPQRFPGNPEVCDPEGHDEDCDGSTFGDRDTDSDGYVDARCCNDTGDGDPVCGDDCDDFNRTSHPEATEVCDELDNDCDGGTDEGVRVDGFADLDGDLHGDPLSPIEGACAGRAGFSLENDDCDDDNPAIHGAQAEICDLLDNDCDGMLDEDAAPTTWYVDLDGDGFGDPGGDQQQSCEPLDGYSLVGTDCDDADGAIHPAAVEECDGIDNNCDARVDDGVSVDGFVDSDVDGFGDGEMPTRGCEGLAGFAVVDGDCDDLRVEVSPAGVEICDELDNDCDGTLDEQVRVEGFADEDRDLYGDSNVPITGCLGSPGLATQDGDCDDQNPAIHPSQPELCDVLDNDCDGTIDEAIEPVTWYADVDGDGFGAVDGETAVSCAAVPGFALLPLDCDDTRPGVNPAAAERCDGIDNDCNGVADFLIAPGDREDDDLDGRADVACPGDMGSDCDDRAPGTYPGAVEICDGIDNDCDGEVDDEAEVLSWLPDMDGDGYGAIGGEAVSSCAPVVGHAARGGDCDDANPLIRPGSRDLCDGIDNDCDGDLDEDADRVAYYLDGDGDSFHGGEPVIACEAPEGGKLVAADCDDGATDVYPGAAETCNQRDEDCDGKTDEGVSLAGYVDDDGDLHGDPGRPVVVCLGVGGVSVLDDDCDDQNPARHGGQPEVCDGIDNDCDEAVDEGVLGNATWYNDNDADGFGDPDDPSPILSCDPQPLHSIRTGDCNDLDPEIHEGAPEVCDSIDNDCDGTADEGLLDLEPEVCNGDRDDDCDGQVDEGCECTIGDIEICGSDVGPCEPGIRACDAPGVWSACLGGVVPQPELCDGIDNDCDGVDDYAEGCECISTEPPRPCGEQVGVGVCQQGLQACVGGTWGECIGDVAPSAERCDGLDNDCNGESDEGETCRIFHVGGSIVGLVGTVELSNGAEKLVMLDDGTFMFDRLRLPGDPYDVTVTGQPDDQVCIVENGNGSVPMDDVADIVVRCGTVYRVAGTVSGISGGTLQLSLVAGGGAVRGAVYLTQDGPFRFERTVPDGGAYEVSVSLAPPGQACIVENPIGIIEEAQVQDVVVTCVDAPHYVGGTLSGAAGEVVLGLSLVGYGSEMVALGADGSYAFALPTPDGAQYMVMLVQEPATQQCTIANGMGTVAGTDVVDVDVTCVDKYQVGGTASGLSGPVGLTLNGGPTLQLTSGGAFSFPDYLLEGSSYDVALVYEPLGQRCTLSGESGAVPSGPVTTVGVDCVDLPFTVGGDVIGLNGFALLRLNDGPELRVTNGSFTFPENVDDAIDYEVTLVAQPAGHVCTLQGATGSVAGADVTDVVLDCRPEMTYSIGGGVAGLSGSLTLVLETAQQAQGEQLVVNADGSFEFARYLADGVAYQVSVVAEPASQRCSVVAGSGVVAGVDVTDVAVTCADAAFRVGGTASGLPAAVELRVNDGPVLSVGNGDFAFPDKLSDGATYTVTLEAQPPGGTCELANETGSISGADVSDVLLTCVSNPTVVDTFPDAGSVTGSLDVITVTASEALDPGTIADAVILTWAGPDGAFGNGDDQQLVPGMTALVDAGLTIELSLITALTPGQYYVDVTPAATSLGGAPLSPHAFFFTVFGSTDTDLDGVPDSAEAALGLTVGLWDSDGDGLSDGMEDFDGDLLVNTAEFLYGTDPAIVDSDGDGISDADEDDDWDGLKAADEFAWGSDPDNPDTDADGFWDVLETSRGGDPLRSDVGPVLFVVGGTRVEATIVQLQEAMLGSITVARPPATVTIVDLTDAAQGQNITVANPPIQATIVDLDDAEQADARNTTIASPPVQVTIVDLVVAGGGNLTVARPPVQTTIVDLAAAGAGEIAIANPPVQTTIVSASGGGSQSNVIVGSPPVEVDAE